MYNEKLDLIVFVFIFNIIITNKNNTAIAPTYTIKNNKDKNSTSIKSKRLIMLQNKNIKNKTECTALDKLIIIIPETIAKLENKENSIRSYPILIY